MDIRKFFDLPEDEQERIVKAYLNRATIKRNIAGVKSEIDHFTTQLLNIQERCDHPCPERYDAILKEDIVYICYKCPDCGKEWDSTDA